MSETTTPGVLSRTRFAVGATLARRDALLVLAAVTLGYLLAYLSAIGHLSLTSTGLELLVVDQAASRFFQPSLGAYSFEPVARVDLFVATYLFSLNTVLGFALATLVGLNVAVTYLAWRQPKACGIGSSSAGLFAGLPALLSGAACCGPVLLIVLGIQATGVLLTAFELLLPAAAVLLVGSLLLVGRQVDPERLDAGTPLDGTV